jgi:nitrogen fixation NifU-like protein
MEKQFNRLDEHVLGNPAGNYSQAYLDHALKPKNTGNLPGANGFAAAEGHDGNSMEVWLKVDDDIIGQATFWTDGCGTTIACGSMMTELATGKNIVDALGFEPADIENALGGLPGEGCVCAGLAVSALKAAIRDYLQYKNDPWKRRYRRI